MKKELTLGSLFDGSGGFPLGGLLAGITPVWASEIEPFPIRVTTKRLPDMKHYGDVSKIDGGEIEPVDIITFGSPCQDLSVAGKREGIEQGQRSSLFFEAIRIIKEMRGATNGRYPTFIVWENVPGVLSSGGGQDFRRVLEEVCGIKEADVSIPRPAKWSSAGEIVGDGFSVAWRLFNAQYWGVPQRRKRVYLVGDFAGERGAGKILFESEGVRGYSPESLKAWQRASGDTETVVGAASEGINGNIAGTLDGHYYLGCGNRGGREREVVAQQVLAFDRAAYNQGENAQYDISIQAELAQTIVAKGPGGVCAPMNQCATGVDLYNASITDDVSKTLNSAATDSDHTPCIIDTPKTLKIRGGCAGGGKGALIQDNKSATIKCANDQTLFVPCAWDGSQTSPTITAHNANGSQRMPDKEHFNCVIQTYGISAYDSNAMKSSNPHSGVYEADTSRCLDLNGGNPACNQGGMAVVCVDQGGGKSSCSILDNLSPTLACTHAGEPVIAVEGNGTRPSHKGSGYSEDNVSFTLNATEHHGVAYAADDAKVYDARGNGDGETACTITGDHNGRITDYTTICKQGYIVRRLTPTECARLQGFPDWWCADLDTPDPTEDDIAYWSEVFETYRKVVNPDGKPKTKKQIIKWLQHPHTDSAEYKMWGNGVALPCVYYVMQGIANIMSED